MNNYCEICGEEITCAFGGHSHKECEDRIKQAKGDEE